MRFLSTIEKKFDCWFLIITSFLFIILRLPSLFEPLWYGDEGIYQVIGFALRHGRLLYRDIWDNKPPLLYLLYAIFQGDQFTLRLANILAGLVSVVLFYWLAKKLFSQHLLIYGITSIFALILALPLLEGNIANAENFMMPLILAAGIIIVTTWQMFHSNKTKPHELYIVAPHKKEYLFFLLAGLLLGLAVLYKIVAIFDLAAFTLFFLFVVIRKLNSTSITNAILYLIPLAAGFIFPLACVVLFFMVHHAFGIFLQSAFFSNIGYVNYSNTFIIPQGLLILKLVLLLSLCGVLWLQRQKLSPGFLFVVLWFAFSIFNALFSQRPYTHYLLVLLPSACLFLGIIFQRTKSQSLMAGLGFLVFLYMMNHFDFYKKNISYFENFGTFVAGRKSITEYRQFFDANTPKDYAIADFLQTQLRSSDQIFLWGNDAQLYRMVSKLPPGKFIVAYHITWTTQNEKETETALMHTHPRFIIIMPNTTPFPYRIPEYSPRVIIDKTVIYERTI